VSRSYVLSNPVVSRASIKIRGVKDAPGGSREKTRVAEPKGGKLPKRRVERERKDGGMELRSQDREQSTPAGRAGPSAPARPYQTARVPGGSGPSQPDPGEDAVRSPLPAQSGPGNPGGIPPGIELNAFSFPTAPGGRRGPMAATIGRFRAWTRR
jgi:hypothetical protein